MRKVYFALLIFVATQTAFGQEKNNIGKSLVTFKIKNAGFTIGGSISSLQGTADFDPANLAASKIEATADVTTINTDNELRDEHLKGVNFLDISKYPKITIHSVSFSRKNSGNYIGQFNITIKDKTKLISIPFSYSNAGGASVLKGTFKINRLDFGVGGSSMILSDEIAITIEAEATSRS
ncbi:YceI family protein [Mucilaginibacter gilvus]|uniref:Polyisoprenoid-binding protein n=1 Tax=Mucilaginibacter gilvus TaxID=2305909 RepID=A0A3S3URQ4_9SPHI|nr:YceI family protein [Mucilaginibacter gilvus]RWY49117.1 polyisoprenoid-binding protein [Mucilaginibacter gilvus]